MDLTLRDIFLLSPELATSVAALIVIGSDLAFKKRDAVLWLAMIGLFVSFLFTIVLWFDGHAGGAEMGFNSSLIIDKFALFFKFLILGTLALVLLAARETLAKFRYQAEFVGLVMFSATGLMLLSAAADLITIFVALELASLPVVALVAFSRDSFRGSEAGLKYLLLGAISSAVLLYGFAFLYGATGTIQVVALDSSTPTIATMIGTVDPTIPFGSVALMVGTVLAIAGFGFKLSVVPFQMWTPDVYEGAPTPVGAFLAVASKGAGLAVVLRVFYTALGNDVVSTDWALLFAAIAAVTMSVGNLVAIAQTNLKRLLGYSTIAQAGYMLVGVAAITARTQEPGDAGFGAASVVFYLAGYAAMNLAAFFVVIAVVERNDDERIQSLAGMGRISPWLAGSLTLALLSLTGIPPTVGFMGKFFLFNAAINAGFVWLAVVGVVNSAVSAYYYFNVIKIMYLREPENLSAMTVRVSTAPAIAIGIATLSILVFGLWPSPLLNVARTAVASLV